MEIRNLMQATSSLNSKAIPKWKVEKILRFEMKCSATIEMLKKSRSKRVMLSVDGGRAKKEMKES